MLCDGSPLGDDPAKPALIHRVSDGSRTKWSAANPILFDGNTMRPFILVFVASAVVVTAMPASAGTCRSEINEASRCLDRLQSGPNTRAAQRHLSAARHSQSTRECVAELRRVDYYAKRSTAADHGIAR